MRHGILLSLALLAVPALAATVPEDSPELVAMNAAWHTATVETLTRQGGADALFTAALLSQMPPDQGHHQDLLAQLDRAATLAPEAADIAALDLQVCRATAGCDVAVRADRLERAAPRDAQFLTPRLSAAVKASDETAVTATLERMASLDTLHDYWLTMGTRIERALQQTAPHPLAHNADEVDLYRNSLASAIASANQMMPFNDIATSCKPAQAAFAARRTACARLGDMLRHSSSMISNLIGLRLSEWAATDVAEQQAIQQRRRQIRWQTAQYHEVVDLENPENLLALHAAMLAAGSEVGGFAAELSRIGAPLQPPAGWKLQYLKL